MGEVIAEKNATNEGAGIDRDELWGSLGITRVLWSINDYVIAGSMPMIRKRG